LTKVPLLKVRFGDAQSLLEEFESIRTNPDAIRSCQQESKAMFCEQFNPAKLAQQSGFAQVVERLKR